MNDLCFIAAFYDYFVIAFVMESLLMLVYDVSTACLHADGSMKYILTSLITYKQK